MTTQTTRIQAALARTMAHLDAVDAMLARARREIASAESESRITPARRFCDERPIVQVGTY